MKKSGKILIVILCLIILGLVTFIVVDKVILKKSAENKVTEENSISNRIDNSVNNVNENNEEINNVTKNDNSQKQNNISSLNGTYERPDDNERTTGKLTITNASTTSFYFEIDATKIMGQDIEKSIANGSINMGGTYGIAKKVPNGTYEYIPEDDDELMETFEGEYKIIFTVNSDKSIKIEETYDKNLHSQGPYSGGNVWFDGVYQLITKETSIK